MRTGVFATISLIAILVTAQGCSLVPFLKFFDNLLIAVGLPPAVNDEFECLIPVVRVLPGTCALFDNPCNPSLGGRSGPWVSGDSFVFGTAGSGGDAPEWLSVRTVGSMTSVRTREICVAADAPLVRRLFQFTWVPNPEGEQILFRAGVLHLTTATELRVAASAMPTVFELGQSTQLNAEASGGLPPYTFKWGEPFATEPGINDTTIPNPIATPSVGGLHSYLVLVTDALGQGALVEVTAKAG